MHVVDERVSDAGGGENGWNLRLPDTLGQPGAGRFLAEFFAEVFAHAMNLLDLVLRRNGNEDRFVEAATDHFHLLARGKFAKLLQELRMAQFEPFEQRTCIMESHADARVPRQAIDERQIGALVGLLEHGIKIPDRLVAMDQEDEMELRQWAAPQR